MSQVYSVLLIEKVDGLNLKFPDMTIFYTALLRPHALKEFFVKFGIWQFRHTVFVNDLEHGGRDFHCLQDQPCSLWNLHHTLASWGGADVLLDKRCVVIGYLSPSESKTYQLA